jgi:hypothetical protein
MPVSVWIVGIVRSLPARRAGVDTMAARSRCAGFRFPAEIISHAVWLYFRF